MRKLALALSLIAAACTTPAEIRQATTAEMREHGFIPRIASSSAGFKTYALEKITEPELPTRVYIEGDGRAFTANGVSPDPTPDPSLLIELIKQDSYPNIVYFGRPCQYGLDDSKCEEKYWTTARFSEEVITYYQKMLLFPIFKEVELVGYSGGGAIVMALAERSKNVKNVRTIAGNIDHNKFSQIHEVPPLHESIAPQHAPDIPQIHFIGEDDGIVPQVVAESFKARQDNLCTSYVLVEGADHSHGWKEKWASLLKTSPLCR